MRYKAVCRSDPRVHVHFNDAVLPKFTPIIALHDAASCAAPVTALLNHYVTLHDFTH